MKSIEYRDHRIFRDMPINYIYQLNGIFAVYMISAYHKPVEGVSNIVGVWKRKQP